MNLLLLLLLGCMREGPAGAPGAPPAPPSSPGTPSTSGGTTSGATATPTITVPETCERASDYDDWPGGRRMRLEVGDYVPGAPLSLVATGAVPGDRVVFEVGRICALDCPVELDGACFQPAGAVVIGEGVADATGTADLVLSAAPSWTGEDWFGLQATAPDAPVRYLSQVVVDSGAPTPSANTLEVSEVSPATIRNIDPFHVFWPVAAGRRAEIAVTPHESSELRVDASLIAEGIWTTVGAVSVAAGVLTVDADVASTIDLDTTVTAPYGFSDDYVDLDLRTVPRPAAVDWYADLDGDGFGDPASTPTASTTPIPGRSADPRDCDDAAPAVHPWGAEICDDGVDQDCDGADRPCVRDPALDWAAPATGSVVWGEAWSMAGMSAAVGDFDGDGVRELATLGNPGGIYALERRDQAPQDAVALFSGDGEDLVAADFDGDGLDDVAVLEYGAVDLGHGPFTSDVTRVPSAISGLLNAHLAAGDATGDGVAELLTVSQSGTLAVYALYAGPGWGTSGPTAEVIEDAQSSGGTLADADGDGLDDLWTTALCVYLSPLPVAGAAAEGCVDDGVQEDDLGAYGRAPIVTDIDGDGVLDAAITDWTDTRVFLGPITGTSSVAAASWFTFSTPGSAGMIAILGSPGEVSLVVAAGEIWVVDVTGGAVDHTSATTLESHPEGYATDVLAGDFDGDGQDDIALADGWAAWGPDPMAGVVWLLWGG